MTVKGTYVGLTVLEQSAKALYNYCIDNKIPVKKSLFLDKLHTTLIYSRKYCPRLHANPGVIHEASVSGFTIFTGQKGENVLVALLNAPSITARHLKLMAEHNATYDFPVYQPHITLSYDFGKADVVGLPAIDFPILLGKEYSEDLNLDWK